jgi:MYXO-CTERM domain-containing protein
VYSPPSLGCAIGILDYSNFSYVNISNGPGASNINVTPSSDGFGFTQVGGAPFTASGDVIQFEILYQIFIDPAPVIPGAKLSIDPSGNVDVTEYFCNDSNLSTSPSFSCFPPVAPPPYSISVTPTSPTATITFAIPAQIYETVAIVFTLDGTNGLATLDGADTDTFVSPEPASLWLLGLAVLAGAAGLRKYRRS